MKIYTKTGDAGETGLFGGTRVSKADGRVEAYGAVDELNAVLGVVRAHPAPADVLAVVERIQSELFDLGAELATAPGKADRVKVPHIGKTEIDALEHDIDRAEGELPTLRNFILPSGVPAAASLHHARTVCRRAERRIIACSSEHTAGKSEHFRPELIQYVNRLSDLLFVLARLVNARANVTESEWAPRKEGGTSSSNDV
ncbi:MAG: cob(I)yrinic acid a,c-diamide adenosyltransferase [Myxococcales bacterium]|nr:cob(I)yrinic acid a,c-diamide adenosyltransferase [Myxococcales bacterium]